jgi:hypothetical protein
MGILTVVERYAHARNGALLRALKGTAVKGRGDVTDLDGYELHTHPDLCDHLQALNRHCTGGAYGVPVLANDDGVIFAVARGTSFLAFLLPEPDRSEAKAAGGADYPEAGDDWVSVEAWRTDQELLTKWCRAAHAHANKIGKGKTS